jgi:hypothetical protein
MFRLGDVYYEPKFVFERKGKRGREEAKPSDMYFKLMRPIPISEI